MRLKKIFVLLVCCILTWVCSISVSAQDYSIIVAVSEDGTQTYDSIESAWNAVTNNTSIVLMSDWKHEDALVVPSGVSAKIEMNGHQMYKIKVSKEATLTLTGYYLPETQFEDTQSGGLITKGGITLEDKATLNLDKVALTGNKSAIKVLGEGCKVNASNSVLTNNKTKNGAGILISGKDCSVVLDNTYISGNTAKQNGGAVYSNKKNTNIEINNNSVLSSNNANQGGAIYLNGKKSNVSSSDSTGVIQENKATCCGGAIVVDGKKSTISQITFEKNVSKKGQGGALDLKQAHSTVSGCTFSRNKANLGGAIYNESKKNAISSCTIKNNVSTKHGAGIYCLKGNDISFDGDVVIKKNTKKKKYENVYLPKKTYILSTPSENSQIGITTSNKKVCVNQASYIEGVFFLDDGTDYHLEFKEKKNLLVKKSGVTSSQLIVNDTDCGTFNAGETILIDGTDTTKWFESWNETKGIDRIDLEDQDEDKTQFIMPAVPVTIKAKYCEEIKEVNVSIEKPEVGKTLPTTASLSWVNSDNETKTKNVDVCWLVDDSVVSGVAKCNTEYVPRIIVSSDIKDEMMFSQNMFATLKYIAEDMDSTKNCVVDDSYTATITGVGVKTDQTSILSVANSFVSIQEGTSEGELLSKIAGLSVTIISSDSKSYTGSLDTSSLDVSNVLNGGSIDVPIISNDLTNPSNVTCKVDVVVENVQESNPLSLDYNEKTQKVTVNSTTENPTIYYTIDDGDIQNYNTDTGIVLTGVVGGACVHTLRVWQDGYSQLFQTYVLDHGSKDATTSYTLTVNATNNNDYSISNAYVYPYGKDIEVVAPSIQSKRFVEWQNLPEGLDEKSSEITISGLTSDLNITAVYEDIAFDEENEKEDTQETTDKSDKKKILKKKDESSSVNMIVYFGIIFGLLAFILIIIFELRKHNREEREL